MLLLILHLQCALSPASVSISANRLNRRAILDSATALSAVALASRPCYAAQILDLSEELSAPESANADGFTSQPLTVEVRTFRRSLLL